MDDWWRSNFLTVFHPNQSKQTLIFFTKSEANPKELRFSQKSYPKHDIVHIYLL